MPFKTPTPGNKNHRKNNKISRKLLKSSGSSIGPTPGSLVTRIHWVCVNYNQIIYNSLNSVCTLDFMVEEEIFKFGQNNWVWIIRRRIGMNARGGDDVGPDQRQGHRTSGIMKCLCEMYNADIPLSLTNGVLPGCHYKWTPCIQHHSSSYTTIHFKKHPRSTQSNTL